MVIIDRIELKKDEEFGNYYTHIDAEPYDTRKDHFIPSFRDIYVSSEMYPGTERSFFYITSSIHGKMRLYRKHTWFETNIGNIFASGKTLSEAVANFEPKFINKVYNIHNK